MGEGVAEIDHRLSASAGWAPAIAAAPDGASWAAADEHHVHLWSRDRLARSVDLPGVLGGGSPRFLSGDELLAGRFAIDVATGSTTERLPVEPLAAAYDSRASADRIAVRSVAWTSDGRYALVRAEYPPTREYGKTDDIAPGAFLALVGPDPAAVTVLDRGTRLGKAALAGDRWLCSGGRGVRVVDPAGARVSLTFEPRAGVSAIATLADLVVAGLAAGEVIRLDAADPDAEPQRWARHDAVVEAVAVSPDGALVASGDEDGHLAVWSADGSAAVLEQTVPGRVDGLCFVAADHLVVAVGGPDRQWQHLELPGGG